MYKLQLKDNPQRGLWLVGEKIRIGSDKENDLVLEGLGIDKFHAQILIQPDRIVLQNLGVRSYVNNMVIDGDFTLTTNDEIRIGRQRLIVMDSHELEKRKQASKIQAVVDDAASTAETEWSLVSTHPQLKDNDYTLCEKTVLGRGKECDIVIPYKLLSRMHAQFTVDEGGLLLTDLVSSNGTFVNGNRVDQIRVNPGDKVSFAKLVFTVQHLSPESGDLNSTMMRPAISIPDHVMSDPTQLGGDRSEYLDDSLELDIEQVQLNIDALDNGLNSKSKKSETNWLLFFLVFLFSALGCWYILSLNL